MNLNHAFLYRELLKFNDLFFIHSFIHSFITSSKHNISRQESRRALLQQMKEKDEAHQTHLTERIKESDFAINYDRICLQQDKEERISKEKYLQQFRNENKRVSIFNFPLDSFFVVGQPA